MFVACTYRIRNMYSQRHFSASKKQRVTHLFIVGTHECGKHVIVVGNVARGLALADKFGKAANKLNVGTVAGAEAGEWQPAK